MSPFAATIVEHPFFLTMHPEHRAILLQDAEEVRYKPGDIIFAEGEPANRFFLIQEGKIVLKWGSTGPAGLKVDTLTPGMVLGWSWLFPPFAWHFTAEAVEPTLLIALNGGHLLEACERNHEFGYALMKRIAQVVIRRLQSTRTTFLAQAMKQSSKK